jgi:hypothetical protein
LSLHSELKTLFDSKTIRRAQKLEPSSVDALAVKEAAGAFLRLKGMPTEQAALVSTMKPSTAAALCRWIADPAFWGMVGGISRH